MDFLEIKVNNQVYLVDSGMIKELIHYTKPEFLAGSHELIEGIISHKDKIVPILSFRKLLDFNSFEDTQIKFLFEVEQQHRDWVKEFEDTLLTGKPFTKALDPHKCSLGLWIDQRLKCLKCNNHGYIDILKKELIEQHKSLHLDGAKYLQSKDLSNDEKITQIEQHADKTIAGLSLLRDNIQKLTSAFEQMIIFEIEGIEVGIIVDNIEKNHHLDEKSFLTSTHNLSPNSKYVQFIDHYKLNDKIMFSIKFSQEFTQLIKEFKA